MKLKLIRSGGFIPVTKAAETEVHITEQELDKLLSIIRRDPAGPRIKDGTYYEINVGDTRIPVDLEKVPEKYSHIFVTLRENLKIIKNK